MNVCLYECLCMNACPWHWYPKARHEQQIQASQRFVERAKRLKDKEATRKAVAERKARMKARKREERVSLFCFASFLFRL